MEEWGVEGLYSSVVQLHSILCSKAIGCCGAPPLRHAPKPAKHSLLSLTLTTNLESCLGSSWQGWDLLQAGQGQLALRAISSLAASSTDSSRQGPHPTARFHPPTS